MRTSKAPAPFRSRWLDWTPGGNPASCETPSHLPAKTAKRAFDGFGGSLPGPFQESREAFGGFGGSGSGPSGESDPRPLARVIPFDPAGRVRQALGPDGRGWFAIRSRVLGETVLWTRDAETEVPAEVACLVRFTWDELDILADGNAETLRAAFQAKKHLGGTVAGFRREAP